MGKLVNRAKVVIASATSTVITLGAAVPGYQTFASAGVNDTDIVSYVIEDGTGWEIGQGQYAASGTTLTRLLVQASTNGGAALASPSSSAQIYVCPLASDVGQPSPSVVSSAATVSTNDRGRNIRVSGTTTLTMPATVPPGWQSGTVSNDGTAIVTVAVPSGAALDGVTNGTLSLYGKQKASFYYDTDGWRTQWVDRTPLLGLVDFAVTNAASAAITIPAGWQELDIITSALYCSTATYYGMRASYDGSTFDSGNHNYEGFELAGSAYNTAQQGTTASWFILQAASGSTNDSPSIMPPRIVARFSVGIANVTNPAMFSNYGMYGGSSYYRAGLYWTTPAALKTSRVQLLQLFNSAGATITGGRFGVRGLA